MVDLEAFRKAKNDKLYAEMKALNLLIYKNIAAFASTVDLRGDETEVRFRIERYCMALAKGVITEERNRG